MRTQSTTVTTSSMGPQPASCQGMRACPGMGPSPPQFDGDTGELDPAARKALIAVVKWEFISDSRYPAEWKALLANRVEITKRLNELFLELHVDTERKVAFKRQAPADGAGKFPTLLYDRAWSREETILLVFLRRQLRQALAAGDTRFFVERADMLAYVDMLRPATATHRSNDKAATLNAIGALHGSGLLRGRKESDTFEIDRAIEVILPLERLDAMLAWVSADGKPAAQGDDEPAGWGEAETEGGTLL